ncbi:RNA polymerase sigma factor [Sphingomonas sp. MMS24-JH45]
MLMLVAAGGGTVPPSPMSIVAPERSFSASACVLWRTRRRGGRVAGRICHHLEPRQHYEPGRASPISWLATIARNRAIDWRRVQGRRVAVPVEEAPPLPDPGLGANRCCC